MYKCVGKVRVNQNMSVTTGNEFEHQYGTDRSKKTILKNERYVGVFNCSDTCQFYGMVNSVKQFFN